MNKFQYIAVIIFLMNSSCSFSQKQKNMQEVSTWRAVLKAQGKEIPFMMEIKKGDLKHEVIFINGEERLLVSDVEIKGDSIRIPGYIFSSEIRAKFISDNRLEGFFVKKDSKEPYSMPFFAEKDKQFRFFEDNSHISTDFSGRWDATFVHNDDTTKAIGIFKQLENNKVTGTFLTPFGDYRFLEGQIKDKTIYLSAFDGTHVFLFEGEMLDNKQIKGEFWSGLTWYETWSASKNDTVQLPNPENLTYVKERYNRFDFEFPDMYGDTIRLRDKRFENKVCIVQITGSWCPNCMDEIRYLKTLKQKYASIELLAVAFERFEGEELINHLTKYQQKMQMDYPVAIGGKASTKAASDAFPLLSNITSFPTLILVDKNKRIRLIHTGFSGPGTGLEYEQFTKSFEEKLEILLNE